MTLARAELRERLARLVARARRRWLHLPASSGRRPVPVAARARHPAAASAVPTAGVQASTVTAPPRPAAQRNGHRGRTSGDPATAGTATVQATGPDRHWTAARPPPRSAGHPWPGRTPLQRPRQTPERPSAQRPATAAGGHGGHHRGDIRNGDAGFGIIDTGTPACTERTDTPPAGQWGAVRCLMCAWRPEKGLSTGTARTGRA
jgi:hypothetical protein